MSVEMAGVTARAAGPTAPFLDVSHLSVMIDGDGWRVAAVDDISFHVDRAEVLGIVGESGSGKSLTALAIMRLVDQPVRIAGGAIAFGGRDLMSLGREEMRRIRGSQISMIFQDPMTSLDETFTIGRQLVELVRAHRRVARREAEDLATQMLQRVGIASPKARMRAYPHELSGGMRQRVVIAAALLLRPALVIADEITTALDATTQAQILELLIELRKDFGMSVILISHDLGVVNDVADRIAVMYAGHLLEIGDRSSLLAAPMHPYTQGLLSSRLSLLSTSDYVSVLEGQVPGLRNRPQACRFAPRCPNRVAKCTEVMPELVAITPNRDLRCHNPTEWHR
ncbi:MAG: ABC transporter ATP-binding protein [Candidatus Dormibacteraceae bacterium]